MKKEEHLFFVEHKPVDLKQTNARSKDKIAGTKKRQKLKLHS
jgi:hypothetical protein